MEALRTLIVDDSLVMRKIVERTLRQAGIAIGQVIEAGNGSQALDILRHQAVDLVLSDINMPVMDGLEFVRQLRTVENARGVPVLMISTEGSESHVVEAISCGARGYIRKPFTPDQMKRQVLALLAKPA
jgi:two-component system, chemotaxis family, chemotaxis protein CheY